MLQITCSLAVNSVCTLWRFRFDGIWLHKAVLSYAVLSELLLQVEVLSVGRCKPGRCTLALRRANSMRELLCLNCILSSTISAVTFQGGTGQPWNSWSVKVPWVSMLSYAINSCCCLHLLCRVWIELSFTSVIRNDNLFFSVLWSTLLLFGKWNISVTMSLQV